MDNIQPMKKEISVIHTNHLIDCLKDKKGEESSKELLSHLTGNPKFLVKNEITGLTEPVSLDYLDNPNNWVSNEFSLKTFEVAAKILGGNRPIFKLGKMIGQKKMKGARGPLIKLLLTSRPEIIMKKIETENKAMSKSKYYEVALLKKNKVILRMHFYPGIRFHKNICEYNLGGFTGGFKIMASKSEVREIKCIQDGYPFCEYEITWESKKILDWLIDTTFRRYKILKEVKSELEAEHERSLDLVFNLENKVKLRTFEVRKRNEELEKANEEIKRLSDAKSLFLADASHELRTPLAVFKGNIEMLKNLNLKKTESKEVLNLVDDTTDRMTNLVSDLITLAAADFRKNSLHMSIVSLADIVKNVCKQLDNLACSKNIKLSNHVGQQINILGSEDKLVEMIMNIIENAIKYTPSGGSVDVQLCEIENKAVIEVSDTGIGIPKEDISKIFDRFYRVDNSRSKEINGTGLGLSICKWIARAHNGDIDVKSKEGKGSKFIIKLPILK